MSVMIADRLTRLAPSATLTINTKAQELRAQGREVVSLAAGEPDFAVPQHVVQAAKQAMDDDFSRYTAVPGLPEVRQAVADYFGKFYGAKAQSDATMVSNGGKQVLYNLLLALINPGDEVLVPAPYWVSYPAMVQLAEGVAVPVSAPAEAGFKVTPEDLDRHATAKSRVLILNSPNNPTGAVYGPDEMTALLDWAEQRGVFVISDEVYDHLVYAPAVFASAVPAWNRRPEGVAVVGALSKTFAMTGWRFGFALAHPDLIKAMSKLQGQSTSNVCSVVQKAALAALGGSFDSVKQMAQAMDRRRKVVMDAINTWPGAKCPTPDGAFYAFPNVRACMRPGEGSVELCARLLDEAGIAAVPGAAFGDDDCIRLSYAVADDVLAAALHKIGTVLKS